MGETTLNLFRIVQWNRKEAGQKYVKIITFASAAHCVNSNWYIEVRSVLLLYMVDTYKWEAL